MAVEAALVTPVILIMVFGMVEFAFAVRDHVAVTSAVRTGARMASTAANDGACIPDPSADIPCPANGAPNLAQLAADSIQKAGSALPRDSIEYILVYKANAKGYPGAETNETLPTSCTGVPNCVRYTWRPALNAFRYAGGLWDSRTISACFPGTPTKPLDSVGVAMVVDHAFLTKIFGSTITLSDRASMNFEPLPTAECGANQHP